jgi:hypothetical protein
MPLHTPFLSATYKIVYPDLPLFIFIFVYFCFIFPLLFLNFFFILKFPIVYSFIELEGPSARASEILNIASKAGENGRGQQSSDPAVAPVGL